MTLRWVPGWNGLTEPEAVSYVAAVEAADGQELEFGVAKAINDFVLGCKNDGIWDAIKASCILAGARTLSGALVPLVGTAPTNYNFVSGDYNRETGLVGDGSTKYLDSNRNNNADPQNSHHLAVYQATGHTRDTTRCVIGSEVGTGASHLITTQSPNQRFFRTRHTDISSALSDNTSISGLWGTTRNSSAGYVGRYNSTNYDFIDTSSPPANAAIQVFARNAASFSDARLAFYSIGESLDLAALDTRVSNLITAIGAAIP